MEQESSGWVKSDGNHGSLIRAQFVLDPEDVRRGLAEAGNQIQLKALAFLVMGIVLFSMFGWHDDAGAERLWIPLFSLAIAIPALLYGFRRAASKVMENKTEAERHITWEFDDKGYRVRTPGSEASASWDSVHRTVEGKTTFLLYIAANIYQIIPKRAFHEQDLPHVRELLRKHVKPRPQKSVAYRVLILWVLLIVAFLAIWLIFQPSTSQ